MVNLWADGYNTALTLQPGLLCQAFEHYWKYTGDDNFLQEKAYPYFKWTAECILRWLKPGKDENLYYRYPVPRKYMTIAWMHAHQIVV